MKKLLSFLLAIVMIIALIPTVSATELYYDNEWHTYEGNFFDLKVNGEKLDCEVPPIIFNDYSVVPARDVFEKLGATVDWKGEKQQVIVKYGDTHLELCINDKVAIKNGKRELMPIAAKLINGKTMIPARYVGESLGFDVKFDGNTGTISIDSKPTHSITLGSYTHSKSKDTVTVTFNFTKSVEFSHFLLKEPARVVIDTKDTKQGATLKNNTQTGYQDVTTIRIGQQPTGIRIVIDLSEELKYTVTKSGNKLVVKIGTVATITPAPEDEKKDEDKVDKEDTDKDANNTDETETPVLVIPDPPSYPPSRTICIDPGHGGIDPGAIHTDEDGTIWRESEINLGVALMVREILEKNNVKVIMTREKDETVELTTRAPFANEKQTTLFVSIHTNSFMGEAANGIETWGSLEYSATYAGITDKNLAENIQNAVLNKTKAVNRGVKDTNTLAVIRGSVMPSVLIEVGFISNTKERELMFSDDYRRKLAEGIAEGILKTFEEMGL